MYKSLSLKSTFFDNFFNLKISFFGPPYRLFLYLFINFLFCFGKQIVKQLMKNIKIKEEFLITHLFKFFSVHFLHNISFSGFLI